MKFIIGGLVMTFLVLVTAIASWISGLFLGWHLWGNDEEEVVNEEIRSPIDPTGPVTYRSSIDPTGPVTYRSFRQGLKGDPVS